MDAVSNGDCLPEIASLLAALFKRGVGVFVLVTVIHSLMIAAKMGFEVHRPLMFWKGKVGRR